MADNVLKKVSQDERLRNLRESREYAEMQHSWELQDAEERGEKRGEERGYAKAKLEKDREYALKLKKLGISVELIAENTGLSKDVIEAL